MINHQQTHVCSFQATRERVKRERNQHTDFSPVFVTCIPSHTKKVFPHPSFTFISPYATMGKTKEAWTLTIELDLGIRRRDNGTFRIIYKIKKIWSSESLHCSNPGKGCVHALGGYLYWMDYMPDNFPKSLTALYPIIYNYSYILLEGVLTIAVISIPAVSSALGRMRVMATGGNRQPAVEK